MNGQLDAEALFPQPSQRRLAVNSPPVGAIGLEKEVVIRGTRERFRPGIVCPERSPYAGLKVCGHIETVGFAGSPYAFQDDAAGQAARIIGQEDPDEMDQVGVFRSPHPRDFGFPNPFGFSSHAHS
jgi:hypothetical protein